MASKRASVPEPEARVLMRRGVLDETGKEWTAGYPGPSSPVQATVYLLLEYAAPMQGWAPTSEDLAAAAPAAFELLELERVGRGLTEERADSIPSFRRRYGRVLEIIAAEAPPPEAA
jgi:hypothetical protein